MEWKEVFASHISDKGLISMILFFFFVFLPFLGLPPRHMDVPRPMPEPQQCQIRAKSATYTTAHGNAGSFNPLSEARDGTHNLMVPSRIH